VPGLAGDLDHAVGLGPVRAGSPVLHLPDLHSAALALAGEAKPAVFALLYDADNPYFSGCGNWPGWASALEHTLEGAQPNLTFKSASWQELVAKLPLDPAVRAWASEKHALD
jgi:hypothetical protein